VLESVGKFKFKFFWNFFNFKDYFTSFILVFNFNPKDQKLYLMFRYKLCFSNYSD